MTLRQALVYFLREAVINLLRSWKVSLLAVGTIAVSLFVGGAFLLIAGNLTSVLDRWQREGKVVAYLEPDAPRERVEEVIELLARPWVTGVEEIDQQEALSRFAELFPRLSDLAEGWEEDPLPPSLEASIDPSSATDAELELWLRELRRQPAVAMVDDDRDWLGQLETVIALVRSLGLVLGLILLVAAVFTIASLIRLTAYLYHDEIAIMRLVGATEFFIRGPFYAEGLVQGLLGGLVANGALWLAFRTVSARTAESPWAALLTERFLSLPEGILLVLAAGAAGLAGAVLSLRRERLGATEP